MTHVRSSAIHRELVMRELAIKSLHGFLAYRFHQEKRNFIDNWHLGLMCEVQTAVIKRQETRVLYTVPFRSLKTETIEQSSPAWMILHDDSPASSVLSAGADATLAEESSEKTREIVGSSWFAGLARDLGKEIMLDPGHQKRNDWKTTGGCERKSVGVNGTVVGKGADNLCIAEGQRVLTSVGWTPINEVCAGSLVATPIGWKRVRALISNGEREVIKITAGQSTLLLTSDHRCSTPDGWRQAGELKPGDTIHALCLSDGKLPNLRQGIQDSARKGLLSEMRSAHFLGKGSKAGTPSLSSMRERILPREFQEHQLFTSVLQYPQVGYVQRSEEPWVQGRQRDWKVQGKVQETDFSYAGGYSPILLDLQRDWPYGSSSYRLQPSQRFPWESSGVVRPVSSRIAQTETTGRKAQVYDLQVEEAHCFYAEGLLVHNCWGDILKPKEANSDIIRTKTCAWLGETFRSRLNDPKNGTIVGIMQRLHELDPVGYLLDQAKNSAADQWLLIKIAMECPRARVYAYGDFYYERKAGELMHPARVDEKVNENYKISLGINYEGQCNQDPKKMDGNTVKMSWINWIDDDDVPKFKKVYQSIDVAVTEKDLERGCYTVIKTWARSTGNQIYLLDVFRAKIGSVALVESIIEQAQKWKPQILIGTKGVIETTVLPFLHLRLKEIGLYLRIETITERGGSKLERGTPFIDACRNGNIYVPKHARWVTDWKLEIGAVPLGAYWDQFDAAAIFFQALDMIRASDEIEQSATEDRDENDGIPADRMRKALGKSVMPNAKAAPASFNVDSLIRSGKRIPATADQYVSAVRREIQTILETAIKDQQHKVEQMAKGEIQRLDRRYKSALQSLSPAVD